MERKERDKSYVEPMPKKQLRAIEKAFKNKGGIIQRDKYTDNYLISKKCEGVTLNENTILLRSAPGRASVFEELIHSSQYRQGKCDGSYESRVINEIEAQKKLLQNKIPYKLTQKEIRQTEQALVDYQKELEQLRGRNG